MVFALPKTSDIISFKHQPFVAYAGIAETEGISPTLTREERFSRRGDLHTPDSMIFFDVHIFRVSK